MHKCSQKVEESFSHFKILLISQLSIKCHGETIPDTAEEKGSFGEYNEHFVTEQLFMTHMELIKKLFVLQFLLDVSHSCKKVVH